jgi:hypothetical protein
MRDTIHKITMLMIVFVIFTVVVAVIGSGVIWYIERGFGTQMAGMLLLGGLFGFGIIMGNFLNIYSTDRAQSAMIDGLMAAMGSLADMTRWNAKENAAIARGYTDQQKMLSNAFLQGARTKQKALPVDDDNDEEDGAIRSWRAMSDARHDEGGFGVEIE